MASAGHENPEFGQRLRYARMKFAPDLTQADIVRHLGITQSALSMYFSGKRVPPRNRMAALAKLLGISVEWLETGRGPMKPESRPYEQLADRLMTVSPNHLRFLNIILTMLECNCVTVEDLHNALEEVVERKANHINYLHTNHHQQRHSDKSRPE